MNRLAIGLVAWGVLAASAEAGLVCATPQEMKVLQSAALQQQLMVAALTCHMSDDYNRFVTAYRSRILQSDRALRAFFAGAPRGEDYNAYKTRIANAVSLRSLHDPRFCESARQVFDLALGRSGERRGLAPEPPQLIDTGYEGCRPVEDRLIEAQAAPHPAPRPAPPTRVAAAPARVAAAAPARPAAPAQRPVAPPTRVAVAMPHPAAAPRPAAPVHPAPVAATPPQPVVLPPPPQPAPGTPQLATAAPLVAPHPALQPIVPSPAEPVAEESPPRVAAAQRPAWRRNEPVVAANDPPTDEDDQGADARIPNAYRPGSVWVGEARPVAYRGGYYPPMRRHRRAPFMVLGPDGRWIVVIGIQRAWVRGDE